MVEVGKAFWHRRHGGDKFGSGHYYYVLCVPIDNGKVWAELAGVGWADSNRDGGWAIEQIGYTVPRRDAWENINGEYYKTATEAKEEAERILRRVLERTYQMLWAR